MKCAHRAYVINMDGKWCACAVLFPSNHSEWKIASDVLSYPSMCTEDNIDGD